MPEPTPAQWKERALVAEALLEDLRSECEQLKAEIDTLKGDEPVEPAKPAPQERVVAGYDRGVPSRSLQDMEREFLRLMETEVPWLELRAPQTQRRGEVRRGPFRVSVWENTDNGGWTFAARMDGALDLNTSFTARQVHGMLSEGRYIAVARRAAGEIAKGWGLPRDLEERLAVAFHDEFQGAHGGRPLGGYR